MLSEAFAAEVVNTKPLIIDVDDEAGLEGGELDGRIIGGSEVDGSVTIGWICKLVATPGVSI